MKPLLALVALNLVGWAGAAGEPIPADAPKLIIYHAGSLTAGFKAVEERFTKETGIHIQDVAGGSVSLARKVTAGGKACDIYAGADFEVIDRMMKPAGVADFSIRIASGAMVLAYTTSSRNAATIAAPGPFTPPGAVPAAAQDWYVQLTQPGVKIGSGNPFLDPGAYRADFICHLAQARYGVPNLYDEMLSHIVIAGVPGGLGKAFDYQFTYEHGAQAAAKADTTGTYRYARLPDEISMGVPALNALYARQTITIPGLQTPGSTSTVTIPAGRVTWGLTVMNAAPNRENAIAFLKLLLGPEGAALVNATGLTALHPAIVSKQDLPRLPASLKDLVQAQ